MYVIDEHDIATILHLRITYNSVDLHTTPTLHQQGPVYYCDAAPSFDFRITKLIHAARPICPKL